MGRLLMLQLGQLAVGRGVCAWGPGVQQWGSQDSSTGLLWAATQPG